MRRTVLLAASVPLFMVWAGCAASSGESEGAPAPQREGDYSVKELTVRAEDDLPKCNPANDGLVAYVTETGTFYVCLRNQWAPIPLPQGPEGAIGPQGPQGATGATGPQGS